MAKVSGKEKLVLKLKSDKFIDIRSLLKVGKEEGKEEGSNSKVIDVLIKLSDHITDLVKTTTGDEKKSNNFRLSQIKKAIKKIEESPITITSGKEAQTLDGIGKGIGERIDEILKTGTLKELSDVSIENEKDRIINEFTSVHGIGEAKANKFYEKGIRSIDELYNSNMDMSHDILIGLKYYKEFKEKIPYEEISDLGKIMKTAIKELYPDLIVEICGSHRRQKDYSGDIDVLITGDKIDGDYLKEIISLLTEINFLIDDLANGPTKYMGVCKHPNIGKGRRIDIRLVEYDSFFPALLYFTGSMELNKLMRTIAIEKGYTLNEYGLYKLKDGEKGEKIIVNSEKDIFDKLLIKYLKPEERNL